MQRRTRFDPWAVGVCSIMMALPNQALAAEYLQQAAAHFRAADATAAITDIELQERGTLVGHLADATGNRLAGRPVVLRQGSRAMGTTRTDANGRFTIAHLRGGIYRVSAGGGERLVRAWMPGTAPPVARNQVLLVPPSPTVRGQGPACGGCGACDQCCRPSGPILPRLLHNPWVLATLVGAAIAIPIGISINDKDPPPAS